MHLEFETHILTEEGIAKAKEIANVFNDALTQLHVLIGTSGRYPAIVRTKLEEASFFAKKAMAVLPENQKM